MTRDWHEWYADYDDPASSLSRRLAEVRRQVEPLLARRPAQVVSMCAGDGRDLLPHLLPGTRALLVELDPVLAQRARDAATASGADVEVRTADAGTTASYDGHVPADVLLACGVFGNVSDDDLARTVAALPRLLAPHAHVVWTRGHRVPEDPTDLDGDPADHVRDLFADAGFDEVAFVRPDDAGYRVGVHRLRAEPAPYLAGERLFFFV